MPATAARPTTPHSHIELPALDCGLRRVRRFAFAMVSSLNCEGIIAAISYRSVGFRIIDYRERDSYFVGAVAGFSLTDIVTCPFTESLGPRPSRLLTEVLLDIVLISQASAMVSSKVAQLLAAIL